MDLQLIHRSARGAAITERVGEDTPNSLLSDRIVVSGPARRLSIALLVLVLLVDAVAVRRDGGHSFGLFLAGIVAIGFVFRGVRLGRPLVVGHILVAAGLVAASAVVTTLTRWSVPPPLLLAAAGLALMLPTVSRSTPERFHQIAGLVERTTGDPLAPFALHSGKSYFLTSDTTAGLAYRTLFGIAVVGGDPVGPVDRHPLVAREFEAFCASRGWRVAVLGGSDAGRALWRTTRNLRRPFAVAFGRDVVIDVQTFELHGRRFRNLRQSVARARNAGVRTDVVAEAFLTSGQRAELAEVMAASGHGRQRGFSMILDRPLLGVTPGIWLTVARDATERVVAITRWATSDHGRELSLDVPWRRPEAPNGVDEHMTVAMIEWAAVHDGRRLSLALAAFPDLFDADRRGWRRVARGLVHLLDPLIAVESLYAYLRKFHALGGRRWVLFSPWTALFAIPAFFWLEFRRHE